MVSVIKGIISKLSGNERERVVFKSSIEITNTKVLGMLKERHGEGPFDVVKSLGDTKKEILDDNGKNVIINNHWIKSV